MAPPKTFPALFSYRVPSGNQAVASANNPPKTLAPYQPALTSGQQSLPNPNLQQLAQLALFGAGIGTLAYVGHMKFGKKTGFDFYHQVARTIEEGSPGRIFRTFQVSQALSPFTTQAQQYRFVSGDTLRAMNQTAEGWMWTEQLKKVVGQDLGALGIYEQGITFREGKLFLGKTKQVILQRAFIIESGMDVFGTLQKGYIRSLFGKEWEATDEGLKAAFTKTFKWEAQNLSGIAREETSAFWIAGGQSRFSSAKRAWSGYGTTLIERMNRLAMEPAEMQPMRWLFEKAPIKWAAEHLPVKSSSGLRTLGRMTAKLGIVAGVGYLAYSQLDYWTRKSKALDNTGLAEGITPAIAHLGITANLKISKIADAFGLHSYREKQEKVAPGSTDIKTLAAFPIVGMLGASITGYAQRLHQEAGLRRAGWKGESASRIVRRTDEIFQDLIAARTPPKDLLAKEELFGRLEKLAAQKTAKFPTQFSLME